MEPFDLDVMLAVDIVVEAGDFTPVVRWKAVLGRLHIVFQLEDEPGYPPTLGIDFSPDTGVRPFYPLKP